MSHFAKINAQGIVEQVIVAEQEFIDTLPDKTSWVQTSYNTNSGKHPEGNPLRKNYAGIGYTYDEGRDAFIPPKPYNSWLLDETTCQWKAPVDYPTNDKRYTWDEETLAWDVVNDN